MIRNMLRRNLIDIFIHVLLAIIFAFIIYFVSGIFRYSAIFFLGGIFIDLDHLIDYYIFFKNKFKIKYFINSVFLKSGKAYLLLHSWEINFIVFIIGMAVRSMELMVFSLSLSLHLIVDNLQRENALAYFLIYRALKKFDISVIFPETVSFVKEYRL